MNDDIEMWLCTERVMKSQVVENGIWVLKKLLINPIFHKSTTTEKSWDIGAFTLQSSQSCITLVESYWNLCMISMLPNRGLEYFQVVKIAFSMKKNSNEYAWNLRITVFRILIFLARIFLDFLDLAIIFDKALKDLQKIENYLTSRQKKSRKFFLYFFTSMKML